MKEKAVVIFSGGPDSTTVLYLAMKRGYDVFPITFDYGQLAKKEIECATLISNKLGLTSRTVDLSGIACLYAGASSLIDPSIPITRDFTKPIIVPFRNGIMLSIAVAYAECLGATHIFYGAQGSDSKNYPDCRKEFARAFESAAQLGTDSKISVEAPLTAMEKSKVLLLGKTLGVPFGLTWSCYRPGERHCGVCEACQNRKKGFAEAGIHDPTEYLE